MVTRTIVCRLNSRFNISIHPEFFRWNQYRPKAQITLIFCLVILATTLSNTWAESGDDWPEPIYFPENQLQADAPTPSAAGKKIPTEAEAHEKSKKGFWLFKGKDKITSGKSGYTEPKFPPRDPPASPYPLLRLSFPLASDAGTLQPGIYLVKPMQQDATEQNPTSNGNRVYTLTRENKAILYIAVHAVKLPDENIKLTGTPSPLTRINPKAPPGLKVESRLSDDQKTITFVITEGENQFESDPFPVATDERRLLTF